MKVPLARTKCGQKLSVLWQVDVGFDEEMEAEQQVVKGGFLIRWKSIQYEGTLTFMTFTTVWEIGTSPEVRALLFP